MLGMQPKHSILLTARPCLGSYTHTMGPTPLQKGVLHIGTQRVSSMCRRQSHRHALARAAKREAEDEEMPLPSVAAAVPAATTAEDELEAGVSRTADSAGMDSASSPPSTSGALGPA